MGDKTGIEWCDASWNPVTGCTKVSSGCDNCYAETIAHRFAGTKAYPHGFAVTLRPERLDQPGEHPVAPLRWKRPRRIFVNSMSDLFHKDVPDEYIARVWAVMALAPQHEFQVLTKRHGRMQSLLSSPDFHWRVWHAILTISHGKSLPIPPAITAHFRGGARLSESAMEALPNVWLGVSVEDQKTADLRIPALLDTPAAVRWLSAEPLIGRVDLSDHVDRWRDDDCGTCDWGHCNQAAIAVRRDYEHDDPNYISMLSVCAAHRGIDWVVAGGESGPGARPMHPDWARLLRDQCRDAGVPYLFKQWGEWVPESSTLGKLDMNGPRYDMGSGECWLRGPDGRYAVMRRVGKKRAGRMLDGCTHDEYPEAGER